MPKEIVKDGPLFLAVQEARGPLEKRRAALLYRENLADAAITERAWSHGGFLFLFLCGTLFLASVFGIWQEFPGENLIPWSSSLTGFLSTYMFGRARRAVRRAVAGWPPCPS